MPVKIYAPIIPGRDKQDFPALFLPLGATYRPAWDPHGVGPMADAWAGWRISCTHARTVTIVLPWFARF